jgi:hypothetical protein
VRTLYTAACVGAILLDGATSAFADPHPSQGANSEGRNPAGFGAGPHCHVLIADHTPFDSTPAFPSHTAHLASGVGHVFAADPNCDGLPGS